MGELTQTCQSDGAGVKRCLITLSLVLEAVRGFAGLPLVPQ